MNSLSHVCVYIAVKPSNSFTEFTLLEKSKKFDSEVNLAYICNHDCWCLLKEKWMQSLKDFSVTDTFLGVFYCFFGSSLLDMGTGVNLLSPFWTIFISQHITVLHRVWCVLYQKTKLRLRAHWSNSRVFETPHFFWAYWKKLIYKEWMCKKIRRDDQFHLQIRQFSLRSQNKARLLWLCRFSVLFFFLLFLIYIL